MFYIAKSLSISAIKRAIGHSQNLGSSLHINFFVTYSLFEKDKTKSIENLGWKKNLQLFIISMEFCSKCSANYYYPTFPTNHIKIKETFVRQMMFLHLKGGKTLGSIHIWHQIFLGIINLPILIRDWNQIQLDLPTKLP